MRKPLVAGNWKMNGSLASNATLLDGLVSGADAFPSIDLLVCPPTVYIESVGKRLAGTPIMVGAQNLSEYTQPGAFTGKTLVSMLTDVGCKYVLVGHSERRSIGGEDDNFIARKFAAALTGGLTPVLCLGETLEEREAGKMESVLDRQLQAVLDECGIAAFAKAVVAYEPVWAIGTGKVATVEQAQTAHATIRGQLAHNDAKIADSVRLLYGGSVKADNAASLFSCEDVDGGLIGGASLKATEFLAICAAAQAAA